MLQRIDAIYLKDLDNQTCFISTKLVKQTKREENQPLKIYYKTITMIMFVFL